MVRDGQPTASRRCLRARALFLAVVLSAPTVYWLIYIEVVKYAGYPTTTSLFYNVVVALVLVRLVTDGLRCIGLGDLLSTEDIRAVYVILALVSAGASLDFTQTLMGIIAYPHHYATPDNDFATELLPVLPEHLVISKGESSRAFWEGGSALTARTAAGFSGPLAWWGLFCMFLLLAGGGLVMLLHRRWSETEHLTYPILEVPAALADMRQPLFRGKLFLLGFAVAAGIETLNSLNTLNPVWPGIPVRAWHPPFNLAGQIADHPWNAIGYMPLSFYPFAIGQGFLLPTNLSFSCWFFYLQWQAQKVLCAWLGLSGIPNAPFIREQSFGGFLGLAVFAAWLSRAGWLREVRAAWRGTPHPESRDARVALACLIAGFVGLVWFSVRAGMSPLYAIAFFAIFLAIGLAIARIRAEMGLPVHDLHYSGPTQMLPEVLGSANLSRGNLAVGELYYWFNRAYRSHYMPHQAEGFRFLADGGGLAGKMGLFGFAWGLGVALSFIIQLKLVFHAGGAAGCVSNVPLWIGGEPWREYMTHVNAPVGPNLRGAGAILFGMAFTVTSMLLSTRVSAWPVHPVGYAVSSSWAMERLWCPLMIAWAWKTLLTRYGGGTAYRRAVPFAVGLVVGDFVSGGLWSVYGMVRDLPLYRFWA